MFSIYEKIIIYSVTLFFWSFENVLNAYSNLVENKAAEYSTWIVMVVQKYDDSFQYKLNLFWTTYFTVLKSNVIN